MYTVPYQYAALKSLMIFAVKNSDVIVGIHTTVP
jgi:hypothetical protein